MEGDVDALAERLGVGERQLRRLFRQHLGASPVSVAQTRRVLFAKQLIHETRLPMAEVALASGFGSIRRFNEIFQRLFGRPPVALRAARDRRRVVRRNGDHAPSRLSAALRLGRDARVPRGSRHPGRRGGLERSLCAHDRDRRGARHRRGGAASGRTRFAVAIRFSRPVGAADDHRARAARVRSRRRRRARSTRSSREDPRLAPLVAARPGLRVPGAWDGFELAVRAVLGQQITVAAGAALRRGWSRATARRWQAAA